MKASYIKNNDPTYTASRKNREQSALWQRPEIELTVGGKAILSVGLAAISKGMLPETLVTFIPNRELSCYLKSEGISLGE